MNYRLLKYSVACAALVACSLPATRAAAQAQACAVPQVTYSPVVYNTYYDDGWYLGKYLGRLGRRIFGTAPAPAAYQPVYSATPATTQSTFAASYAPTANCVTCGTSPCCCTTQTSYRPVVMQAVNECTTCYAPSVTQAGYSSSVTSDCPTCVSSPAPLSSGSSSTAPSLPAESSQPPQTFREKPETDDVTPTPADESSAGGQSTDWDAPQLLDPNDKVTKRPTAPVWTAVYRQQQPAKITAIHATEQATSSSAGNGRAIGWKSGR